MIRAHLLCLMFLALPTVALAAPVIMTGDGVEPDAALGLVEETLGVTGIEVAGPLSQYAGDRAEATVVFGAFPERCVDPPTGGRPIGGVVVMAREEIFNMNYASALERLDAAAAALPCNADAAETGHLYDVFFLRGYAYYQAGRVAEARRSFSQAAAIDPSRPWSDAFPPTPKATYLEALQDLLESEPAPLRVEVADLVLDGRKLERGRPHTVRPGYHLVQSASDVLWVRVPSEDQRAPSGVVVTTSERLTEGLVAGDNAYAPWLREVADANGWSGVIIATEDAVLRFDGRGFSQVPTAAGLKKLPPPASRVAGGVMLGVGGGTLGLGLGLNIGSWATAKPGADGSALMPRPQYEGYVSQNRAGLGLAIAGAAVGATGLVLTLIPPKRPAVSGAPAAAASRRPLLLPWAVATEDSFVVGIVAVPR